MRVARRPQQKKCDRATVWIRNRSSDSLRTEVARGCTRHYGDRSGRRMFGGKRHRKVSQAEETGIGEDSSALTGIVGRKIREEATFGDTVFAATKIGDRARSFGPVDGNSRRSARSTKHTSRDREFEMLAASICCKVYYTMLPSKSMTSQVPRCLFGQPNSRETIEMLQEALDLERSRFKSRWGVDPSSEDKENNYRRRNNEKNEQQSPNRKRSNPYSRQTSIHGKQHFSRQTSPCYLLTRAV